MSNKDKRHPKRSDVSSIFRSGAFTISAALLGAVVANPKEAVSALVAALLAVAVTLALAFWLDRLIGKRLAEAEEDPSERLRQRINRVNKAFVEAATLVDELRRDLDAQQAARQALLAEAARQQELLAISKEDAERIRHILVGETKATLKAERRMQWMFFALGATISIPISILTNIYF